MWAQNIKKFSNKEVSRVNNADGEERHDETKPPLNGAEQLVPPIAPYHLVVVHEFGGPQPNGKDKDENGNNNNAVTANQNMSVVEAPCEPKATVDQPASTKETSTSDTGVQPNAFVKLTSSEKRRFKKALKNGYNRAAALLVAAKTQSPDDLNQNSVKRARSEESLPPAVPNAKKDKLNSSPLSPPPPLPVENSAKPATPATHSAIAETPEATIGAKTSQQTPENLKLGILSANMETNRLTPEQIALIQEAVIDVTIELCADSGAAVKPNFTNCITKSGWLLLHCSDQATAEWMRANFAQIKLKCGLDVVLVESCAFPDAHIIFGCFPQSLELPNAKILATISAQNAGLSTRAWNVVERSAHACNPGELSMVLVIDDISMAKLKAVNGKISYRFGQIALQFRS